MKLTIFISISRGSIISNFFHSGIINKILSQGCKVVILTPNYRDKEFFKGYEHDNLFLEPLISPKRYKLERLIKEFLKGSIFNKTVHVRYKYRFSGQQPRKFLYPLRILFLAPLKFLPGFKKFIRWFDFKINPQIEHDYLFKKYKPNLVFATTAHTESDVAVLKSAKRFGIITVDMPKSWDNLSKILFHQKTDYMIVWSPFMKKQAVQFQDYKKDEVLVTGIPQFDYYTKKSVLLSRGDFCRKVGLNPNKKIILYGSTGGNCFHESEYIELIKKYMDQGKLQSTQVLIRPHLGYIGDVEKFINLEKYPGFIVDRHSKQSNKFKDHWDASIDNLNHLFNSLYHSDLCITIASTLTLDAVICNTPVININFDCDENIDPNYSTKRLYTTDYINEVISIGGTWVSESKDQFLHDLKEILEKNKIKEKQRQKLISYFCYKKDGCSAQRIADVLVNLAKKNYDKSK